VDSLRREKLVFNEIHVKLGRRLAEQKAEMAALLKAISADHAKREKVL
jgi:hypothetical protein